MTTRLGKQAGFTLMELIIVITIAMVMIGVTMPLMRTMHERNKLRATAREIVALMKYARMEAVFGERMTEIFLDTDKNQFWLDLREPDPKTGEYNPRGKKRQLEQKRTLNQQVWFDTVSAYDSNIVKKGLVAVDFFPDGSASPTVMTLTNKQGAKLTVELLKSTGMTEVTAGTLEEKRALQEQQAAANPMPREQNTGAQ